MKTAELKAYDIFRTKFGEKEAEVVFQYFESAREETISPKQVDERLKDFREIFATKKDIARLEGKLEGKLAESKSEMIKWMFIFWATQLFAIFAFIKYLK